MAKRAFIIAIENYAQMKEGLSNTLPGTHQHAVAFRDWLVGPQGLAPADVFFCTEDATLPGRTADATRTAIKVELKRFKDYAKDTTDDMYFYFSGHGFCYVDVDDVPTADVILAADYAKRDESGDACFKLDEIQKWLKMCLGSVTPAGGDRCGHYYFIDACRNKVTEREIKVAPLGLVYDMSVRKKAPVYTLYSTTTGAVANVAGGFPEALIDGLNGKGRSKRWYEGTLAVLFDSLRDYIQRRLDTELDPRAEGATDGVIRKLDPALEYECTLEITNATDADMVQVEVKSRNVVVKALELAGPQRSFKVPPDDYSVQVQLKASAGDVLEPATPVRADLYDDLVLKYEKKKPPRRSPFEAWRGEAARPAPPPPTLASLSVVAPKHASVIIRGDKDFEFDATSNTAKNLAPGAYTVETHDERGVLVDRRAMTLTPGDHTVDLTAWPDTPLRRSLLGAIPGNHEAGTVDFSETLGPTPDQGLDLWLALIGASRIVGGAEDFSKLGPLPLATFTNVGPAESAIYVLAGFDQPVRTFKAVLSTDWRARPANVPPHPAFPGLFEVVGPAGPPGFRYLTIQVDDNAPTTFGVCALPMRGTLVTISQSKPGNQQIQQFILPLKQFQAQLPERGGLAYYENDPDIGEMSRPLKLVRRCVEVQRAFARVEDLRNILTGNALESLLYFKWFEPIVATLAAYELVRRGETALLSAAVGNLRAHFGNLPDAEGLARLAGLPWTMPTAPPLVLEGFQTLDLMNGRPDVPPAEALQFRGPWTMWRALGNW